MTAMDPAVWLLVVLFVFVGVVGPLAAALWLGVRAAQRAHRSGSMGELDRDDASEKPSQGPLSPTCPACGNDMNLDHDTPTTRKWKCYHVGTEWSDAGPSKYVETNDGDGFSEHFHEGPATNDDGNHWPFVEDPL